MGAFSVKLFAEKWTKCESASWQVGKPIGIWLGKLAGLAFLDLLVFLGLLVVLGLLAF